MYKLLISPPAKEDIRDTAKRYNQQKTGLGNQFIKRVREKMAFVKQYPNASPIRFDDMHVAIIQQFP